VRKVPGFSRTVRRNTRKWLRASSFQGRDGRLVAHPEQEGLGVTHWPKGTAEPLDSRQHYIFNEELQMHRLRRRLASASAWSAPVIYTFATKQKKAYLPACQCRRRWCARAFRSPARDRTSPREDQAERKRATRHLKRQTTWIHAGTPHAD